MLDELDIKILRELDLIAGTTTNYYITKQLFPDSKCDSYDFKKRERNISRRLKKFVAGGFVGEVKLKKTFYYINYKKIELKKDCIVIYINSTPSSHTQKV